MQYSAYGIPKWVKVNYLPNAAQCKQCQTQLQRTIKCNVVMDTQIAVATTQDVIQEFNNVVEPACKNMAKAYKKEIIQLDKSGLSFNTAYITTESYLEAVYQEQKDQYMRDEDAAPVCMLHGFDSSSLEFRRFFPQLVEQGIDAYAPDIIGWGFTDYTYFSDNPDFKLTPEIKCEHLYQFWKEKINRKMVILGVSIGGTFAIDFALKYPEAVKSLVLCSPQVTQDGLGVLSELPSFFARQGVRVLRTNWLRQSANKMAYFNKDKYATEDARRIGRLHTFLPGWEDAQVSFIQGGGFSVSTKLAQLQVPIVALWGGDDEILPPEQGAAQLRKLQNCLLAFVPECGHCAHLEQPEALGEVVRQVAIEDFESLKQDIQNKALFVFNPVNDNTAADENSNGNGTMT